MLTENRGKWKLPCIRGCITVLLLLLSVISFQYAAKAEMYLLTDAGKSLFKGDAITLSDYFDETAMADVQPDSIRYTVLDSSQNKDCIALTAEGGIKAVAKGTAIIEISYVEKETQAAKKESFQVTVLTAEQITAEYGTTIWLDAFNMYNPYTPQDLWNTEKAKWSYSFSKDSAVLDVNQEGVTIQGFQNTKVYLEKEGRRLLVAEITVKLPCFEREGIARAKGTEAFFPELMNYKVKDGVEFIDGTISKLEKPIWKSEDETIAALTNGGFLAKETGKTVITAAFTAKNGDELLLKLPLTVTDPKFTKKMVYVAAGGAKKLPVSGVCDASTYAAVRQEGEIADGDLSATEPDVPEEDNETSFQYAYLNASGQLCGIAEGTEEAEFVIDGRKMTITIVVTNPYYKDSTFTMYKGLKKGLTIEGVDEENSSLSFTSGDTGLASVTKAGKVTAKKVGTTQIIAKADGKEISVWVEISTKKAYQAAQKEIEISKTKTKYSQAKRMDKGYYDCSSLVSRVYRQFGVYFGSKSGWSPTAAAIGEWCANHKKVLAKKGMDYTELVPGDLIFYSYGRNGRYRDIGHVEMYVGNGMCVSASNSKNKVIHYDYNPNGVVLIARPTK